MQQQNIDNAAIKNQECRNKSAANNNRKCSNKIQVMQQYIFGKQSFRLSRLAGKVDVIVTDAPIMLSALYNEDELLGDNFNNVVMRVFNSYENRNYF